MSQEKTYSSDVTFASRKGGNSRRGKQDEKNGRRGNRSMKKTGVTRRCALLITRKGR